MSSASATSHSRLADLVGSSRVIIEPEQLASFEIDGMLPAAVIRPESKAHVAEIVKFAGSEKLSLVAAGGVAANLRLRDRLAALAASAGLAFVAPPVALCTDNGAMIAWVGLERLRLGLVDGLENPYRKG